MNIFKTVRRALAGGCLCLLVAEGSSAVAASAFATQTTGSTDVRDITYQALSGAPGTATITDQGRGQMDESGGVAQVSSNFLTGTVRSQTIGVNVVGNPVCTATDTVADGTRVFSGNCTSIPLRINMTAD